MPADSLLEVIERFLRDQKRITDYLKLDRGPYFLAINGVQGSGKSTIAYQLAQTLRGPGWSLPTVVVSIDDFYLKHGDQQALARAHPSNPLIQHRGQPSTHDLALWKKTFENIRAGRPTAIPQYDKSCFSGQGDRADVSTWEKVNVNEEIKVVIFEGWCVGFSALSEDTVKQRWEAARWEAEKKLYKGQLAHNKIEDLLFINEALRKEEEFHSYISDLVHLDSLPEYAYDWRLQQEVALREARGSGMTDEQVKKFIDGYYPSYELYCSGLRDAEWRRYNDSSWRQQQCSARLNKNRGIEDVRFHIASPRDVEP